MMLYVPYNDHDPRMNLAIETYLLQDKAFDEAVIFFYVNDPSVIIGRHQNTVEEINQDVVKQNNIQVVRRLSGGGAVYHDHGNLNFSFILPDTEEFLDFKTLTKPIIDALTTLGIEDVQLSGRNDLVIGDKKISGTAMYRAHQRMFCHGTLLYHSDLERINEVLTVDESKLKKRGIASVRSRVTNIYDHLPETYHDMTIDNFRDELLKALFYTDDMSQIPIYVLTDEDWERIMKIKEERYDNWEWNYGASPDFNVRASQRFENGKVEVRFLVRDQIIEEAYIYGDFFGSMDVAEIEKALVGIRFNKEAIIEAIQPFEVSDYIGRGMTNDDFISLILSAKK